MPIVYIERNYAKHRDAKQSDFFVSLIALRLRAGCKLCNKKCNVCFALHFLLRVALIASRCTPCFALHSLLSVALGVNWTQRFQQ